MYILYRSMRDPDNPVERLRGFSDREIQKCYSKLFDAGNAYCDTDMDLRKGRRSPRRDYTRDGTSYQSPIRRHRRSRSLSRSPVHRHRVSLSERRHSLRASPRRRRSRSLSPSEVQRERFLRENDMYGEGRSRSIDKESRKSGSSIKKPSYRGPDDSSCIKRAITSPSRIFILRHVGKSSAYGDENMVQKQSTSSDRGRTGLVGRESAERRLGASELRDYTERRSISDRHSSSPVERRSPSRHENDYLARRQSRYGSDSHRRDYEAIRKSRNDDRSERLRRSRDSRKYYRHEKSHVDGRRRSDSLTRRDRSSDRRRFDDKKPCRRNSDRKRNDSDRNSSRGEQFDETLQNGERDLSHESEFDHNERDEDDENAMNGVGGNVMPGSMLPLPIRAPPLGMVPRPIVPMPPLLIPPFRPFPRRVVPPFVLRPFRFPRPLPLPRFFQPIPPPY